jgi:hypothetical protein
MIVSDLLVNFVVTVGVGAVSGGITNAVAIWMLFHPYEEKGVGFFRLHGAMPKNKARLARSIGKTVGERLITPADLAERLSTPAVREKFDEAMGRLLDDLLERERGPLSEQLGPDLATTVAEALAALGPRVADRAADYARSPDFAGRVGGWLGTLRAELDGRPVAQDLTDERRAALRVKVDEWVARLAEGDEMESTLRGFVATQLERLSHDDQPLIDRLPLGLIGVVEQAIADYLPVALERLSDLLSDPEARRHVEAALRDAFDHSVRELLLHERILARLVVTDRTIERLVDGFEREGFDRFADALADPAMKSRVTRAVNDAVVNFLRIPLGERLRRMRPERREALAGTLGDWLLRVARDPATRAATARAADRALDSIERHSWGEVVAVVPPARAAELVAELATGERGRHAIEEGVAHFSTQLLARPIGRPAAWLGGGTAAGLRRGLTEAAWNWAQSQIPRVVEELKVEEMVEQKVLGFSTQRMEEIVRNVTQKELDLIVQLGYWLGGLVGLIAFGLNRLLG